MPKITDNPKKANVNIRIKPEQKEKFKELAVRYKFKNVSQFLKAMIIRGIKSYIKEIENGQQ